MVIIREEDPLVPNEKTSHLKINAYLMCFNFFCKRSAKRGIGIRFFVGMSYNQRVFGVTSVILDPTDTIHDDDCCGYQTMWINIFCVQKKKKEKKQ